MTGNTISGILSAEEIVIDRSSWVDQDFRTRGATISLPAAEAAIWGRRIGWKVLDDRPVASAIRADDTLDFADTTALTADRY